MKVVDKSISEIINTDYRDYAMYVLESRAIPSAIDGLKMVSRKLLYSMLNEYSGKKVKLADLSGISKLNYHHSETSAAGAAVTLAADWNNNLPIFTGHGNFGSRLIQDAAAPRYIFVTLSPEFKNIFLDSEIAEKSFDQENPEPAFYLPILPWVLVNGVSGIAVGFKVEILPRAIKDVVSATKACIKNPEKFLKENSDIAPTFPHFSGEVIKHSENQWKTVGKVEFIGKNYYEISELPIGYDREKYVVFLNELCDKDLIKDYSDECSEAGFGFKIKVTGAQKLDIDKDPIKFFKLEKIHTEILTTLGIDGKLKIFKSVPELIHYFCEYRLMKCLEKIEYDKKELSDTYKKLTNKRRFIQCVIDSDIDFRKTSKDGLIQFIFDYVTQDEDGKTLINIPMYSCTSDTIEKLEQEMFNVVAKQQELESLTPYKLFLSRLNSLKF